MADHTESTVLVDAPVEDVLDAIADLEAYPTWAKNLRSVTVLTEDDGGWADEVEFVIDAGSLQDTYALRYTWDVEEDSTGVVSWTLLRSKLLRSMDGSYTLSAESEGTRIVYRLAVDLAIPMPGLLRRRAEKAIVGTALDELKTHVES